MNWEALGAIGEIISAIAVFATLVYLSIQVRHNSQQVWSQNLHAMTSQQHKTFEMQLNSNVIAALEKAGNGQDLSEAEGISLEAFVLTAFAVYANQYEHVKAGINVPNWAITRKTISYYLVYPWIRNWWDEFGKLNYGEDFVNEVESIINEFPGKLAYVKNLKQGNT